MHKSKEEPWTSSDPLEGWVNSPPDQLLSSAFEELQEKTSSLEAATARVLSQLIQSENQLNQPNRKRERKVGLYLLMAVALEISRQLSFITFTFKEGTISPPVLLHYLITLCFVGLSGLNAYEIWGSKQKIKANDLKILSHLQLLGANITNQASFDHYKKYLYAQTAVIDRVAALSKLNDQVLPMTAASSLESVWDDEDEEDD